MAEKKVLTRAFFFRDTHLVARALLGKRLVRLDNDGSRLAGLITETEAYIGSDDLGCHARAGRTARNASMWGPPGHAYVYFTYGMHWMLNIVTEQDGFPAAVLIRAIQPLEGLDIMQARRSGRPRHALTDGPAKLCQALNIDRRMDGYDLCQAKASLFIENEPEIPDPIVTKTPRVGLNHVPEPWKSVPWRYFVHPSKLLSPNREDPP
jgi:DNA-3-methyladenine glycosylase